MLSISTTTRIGKFYADIYHKRPFSKLHNELKNIAKRIEYQALFSGEAVIYITKTNLFSQVKEYITVVHQGEELTLISIHSANNDEVYKIETFIRQFPEKFHYLNTVKQIKSYHIVGSKLMLQIGKRLEEYCLCVTLA